MKLADEVGELFAGLFLQWTLIFCISFIGNKAPFMLASRSKALVSVGLHCVPCCGSQSSPLVHFYSAFLLDPAFVKNKQLIEVPLKSVLAV